MKPTQIHIQAKMMKVFTLGLMVALLSSQAYAAEFKVAVIDMQKSIQSSEEGKKARGELETAFNKRKKELQAEEAALKKMQEEFQKKQSALSDSAKQQKQKEMQERFVKYQEMLQRSQGEIQKKEQEMSEPIVKKIRVVVADVAKKRGYSMVIEKNENVVIYNQDSDDLTDDVIKQINK